MGRYGVVDEGLNPQRVEMILKEIPLIAEDREDMEYVGVRITDPEHPHGGIHNLLHIARGYLAASGVVGIEPGELHPEHGGLNLVETGIDPLVAEDVFPLRTVVGERTDSSGKLRIGGGDASSVAERSEVFPRIEAMPGGIAEAAGGASVFSLYIQTAMSLRVILDKLEAVAPADIGNAGSVGAESVEMYDHHRFCAWGEGLFDSIGIYLAGERIRLHQYRGETTFGDGEYGGYICIGGHYHLVARRYGPHLHVGTQNEAQGIQTVAATYGVVGGDIAGIFFLKLAGLLSEQIPSGADHTVYSLMDLFAVGVGDFLKIKEFYHLGSVKVDWVCKLREVAVKGYGIDVVDHGTPSEALFLIDKVVVEDMAAIFGGYAEINIFNILVDIVYEGVEEKVESPILFPCRVGRDILDMRHCGGEIHHTSGPWGGGVADSEKMYVGGEKIREAGDLLQRVDRTHSMPLLEVTAENIPEGGEVETLRYRETLSAGLADARFANVAELDTPAPLYHRRDTPRLKGCSHTEEGVKILFSGETVIDMWNRLISKGAYALIFKPAAYHADYIENPGNRGFGIGDETAVGKPGVRMEGIARHTSREEGIETPLPIDHQRMVGETVGMIVHIIPFQQECAVLRSLHEVVPFIFARGSVVADCKFGVVHNDSGFAPSSATPFRLMERKSS